MRLRRTRRWKKTERKALHFSEQFFMGLSPHRKRDENDTGSGSRRETDQHWCFEPVEQFG